MTWQRAPKDSVTIMLSGQQQGWIAKWSAMEQGEMEGLGSPADQPGWCETANLH